MIRARRQSSIEGRRQKKPYLPVRSKGQLDVIPDRLCTAVRKGKQINGNRRCQRILEPVAGTGVCIVSRVEPDILYCDIDMIEISGRVS